MEQQARIGRVHVERFAIEAQAQSMPPFDEEGARASLAYTFGERSLLRSIAEVILLIGLIAMAASALTASAQVADAGMEPILQEGQYVLSSKLAYWVGAPQRGDIVLFHSPDDPDQRYLRRIVGLPGERVEIRAGRVWIDGLMLEEPYVVNPAASAHSWNLGEGEYLLLGDNRALASHSPAPVILPRVALIGKAWLCYWPPATWTWVSHYRFSVPEDD